MLCVGPYIPAAAGETVNVRRWRTVARSHDDHIHISRLAPTVRAYLHDFVGHPQGRVRRGARNAGKEKRSAGGTAATVSLPQKCSQHTR